jgi:hypothetical protein
VWEVLAAAATPLMRDPVIGFLVPAQKITMAVQDQQWWVVTSLNITGSWTSPLHNCRIQVSIS